MTAENTPGWALPLFQLVERIDQKLDGHRETIDDHEARIRGVESTQAVIASTIERIAKIEENENEIFTRLRKIETRLWMSIGGITVIVTALEIWSNLVANGAFAKK
jgi:hypothetical protein